MSVNMIVTEPSPANAPTGASSSWTMVKISSMSVVISNPKDSSFGIPREACHWTTRQ